MRLASFCLISAALIAATSAARLQVSGVAALVACAELTAIGAYVVSRHARAFDLALGLGCATVLKYFVLAQPELSALLHTRYSTFAFITADWFIGCMAAISIPLSVFFGVYAQEGSRPGSYLIAGKKLAVVVSAAAWVALAAALYAHMCGFNSFAIAGGMIAATCVGVSYSLTCATRTPRGTRPATDIQT